ncbi:MAG: hypothetical protein ACI9SE_002756, partial [Neolewinella sp.]
VSTYDLDTAQPATKPGKIKMARTATMPHSWRPQVDDCNQRLFENQL